MTDLLKHTYSTRADRAAHAPDLDEVMGLVRDRARERRHRRRTALAAGTTSLAVAALVVTASVAWSGPDTPTARHATTQHSAKAAYSTDGLVAAPPAPAAAEGSLGLLPPGWTYEGHGYAATTYIAPGATPGDPNHFVGKIAVEVGQRYDDAAAYTLTVAGRPARYSGPNADDNVAVGILVPDRDGVQLEVLVVAPVSAGLTRDQLLAMANSLDLRSTVHFAVG